MIGRYVWFLALAAAPAVRAGWAESMFDKLEHDWGSAARGTQLSHQFTITNNTGKPVRIASVKPSCHCVSPMVGDHNLQPGQSTILDARMNTGVFLGVKSVTITVYFDRPRRAEVHLRVTAVSSGNPTAGANEVDFGVVSTGAKVEKKLLLDFTGGSHWKIVGVDHDKDKVAASFAEVFRQADRVRYELTLGIAPSAGGALDEKLRFRTNDPKSPEVLVLAKARVEDRLSIAPDSFKIGNAQPGEKVTKTVVIKAPTPFRLMRVNNTNGLFGVKSGAEPKLTQIVVLTMVVPPDPALIPDHLEIHANLPGVSVISLPVTR
jgi:hypothetical protein